MIWQWVAFIGRGTDHLCFINHLLCFVSGTLIKETCSAHFQPHISFCLNYSRCVWLTVQMNHYLSYIGSRCLCLKQASVAVCLRVLWSFVIVLFLKGGKGLCAGRQNFIPFTLFSLQWFLVHTLTLLFKKFNIKQHLNVCTCDRKEKHNGPTLNRNRAIVA